MRQPADPSLQALLAEASRAATADLERLLRSRGLPVDVWRVLELVSDERGRSMSELAAALSMKLPSLSRLIDRMVAAALVQRAPDPDDQRKVLVYVSDIGLANVRALRAPVRKLRASIDASIGSANGQRLKRLLQEFIRDRQAR
jgi:MarR family transcriptional regulator, organic hydroperoxide resistance regulator